MREPADLERIRSFMRALGDETRAETRAYFTGGATAVLIGWRITTIDVDVRFFPDSGDVFEAIARLKEELRINVEIASPPDFIPELPGWETRSRFVARHGKISFYHYDFYSQVLAKVERRHSRDREDVREMIGRGLVEPDKALRFFEAIEPELRRYPAIDPSSFRRAALELLGARHGSES
jgi:hypothetical protein